MRVTILLVLLVLSGCGFTNEVHSLYQHYAPSEWRVTLYTMKYNWSPSPSFEKESHRRRLEPGT